MLAFSGLVAGSFALGVKVANDITPAAFTLIRFVIAVSILATVLLIKTEFTKKVFSRNGIPIDKLIIKPNFLNYKEKGYNHFAE